MNLTSTHYAFTTAYLRGKEARGVVSDHIDGMLQRSVTTQDALDVIKDTDIGEYLLETTSGGIKDIDDIDECLWGHLGNCIERLRRFEIPSDMMHMLDAYIRKYDVLNIKTALRMVLMDKTSSFVPLGYIHDEGYLEEFSNVKSMDEISEILEKCNLDDYTNIIKEIKEKDKRSTFESEHNLDFFYYREMSTALQNMSDGSVLTKALGIMIDLVNLQGVFRSVIGEKTLSIGDYVLGGGHVFTDNVIKELLSLKMTEIIARLDNSEYYQMAQEISKGFAKDGSITIIDKIMEKHKIRLLRELLSPRTMSPCNLLWYLVLKELEIRNMRLIFKALIDGIPLTEVRDYTVAAQ